MFDIGFSEMMVIAVVALVVIGPEKLPRVARNVGAYLGRLQRYVNDVKADINREIELEELRKFKQQVEETAHSFESSVREEITKTETGLNQVAQEAAGVSSSTTSPPAPEGASAAPALESTSPGAPVQPEPSVAASAQPLPAEAPPALDPASAKRAA